MRNFLRKIPDSLARILVVFLVIIGGALLLRSVLPSELLKTELHVKATEERESAREVIHAGSEICSDCHVEHSQKKKTGYHANLSCETCHGAAKQHSENPIDIKPVAPKKREFCEHCHTYNPSRPTGFPQINPAAHNPLKACISCHDPHDPIPPTVPQQCEGCHASIAKTKSLSPHVRLECTTCHQAGVQHKTTPRLVRATIPNDRSFCGKCHSKESAVKDVPKVDFASHGEKYLCWQCHYPHMPEVASYE